VRTSTCNMRSTPNSALVQLARADGVTRAVSYPVRSVGYRLLPGTGALLRLRDSGDVVESGGAGVFVSIGNHRGDGDSSRAAQWELLRQALDAAKTAAGSSSTNASSSKRDPEVLALEPVLNGTVPLAISTNRESDIRQAIKLATDYSLHVVIIGGTDAWMIKHALAAAKIPVIVDPQDNLPANFDQLGARLDNAALLAEAGVTVATAVLSGIHQSYNAGESLREGAGLAVANGLPYIDAAAVDHRGCRRRSGGVAERCGTIAPGKDGDLVLWDGDPLEPSSAAVTVLVAGKEVSLVTRQKELRDRYPFPKAGLTAVPRGP